MSRFALLLLAYYALCGCRWDENPAITSDSALRPPPAAALPAPVADQPADPALVLPGPFAERTTVADLQARFGAANVQIPDPADRTAGAGSGVVLFPDDSTRRAYVDFHDDETLIGLANISVRDVGSRWRGKHGVHVGMSFAELRRVNGKSFYFSGFDSEGRAWVHDQWSPAADDNEEPRLGALDVEDSDHMYLGVQLGLRGDATSIPRNAYPNDENSVSSDDPRYPKLSEFVEVTEFSAFTSLDDEWE